MIHILPRFWAHIAVTCVVHGRTKRAPVIEQAQVLGEHERTCCVRHMMNAEVAVTQFCHMVTIVLHFQIHFYYDNFFILG